MSVENLIVNLQECLVSEDQPPEDVSKLFTSFLGKLSESTRLVLNLKRVFLFKKSPKDVILKVLRLFQQDQCEKMQGSLFGRGYPDAQTNTGGAASWFAKRAAPAAGQTPHNPAGSDGQRLHGLSETGPGLSCSALIFEKKSRRKKH